MWVHITRMTFMIVSTLLAFFIVPAWSFTLSNENSNSNLLISDSNVNSADPYIITDNSTAPNDNKNINENASPAEFPEDDANTGIEMGTLSVSLIVAGGLIVLGALAFVGYFFYNKHNNYAPGVHEEENLK